MKNIHVLQTEKPSRLCKDERGTFHITESMISKISFFKNQNIYITSDEEKPKAGEWSLYQNKIHKCIEDIIGDEFKKIILTTDKDLIKDGVQAIDDEFLEWFVKNPSCEFVKVKAIYDSGWNYGYKIIIPKEEPKQETLKEVGAYQQELFSYLHDLGIIALQSEMQDIERIVLSMQEQDKKLYSEEDMNDYANYRLLFKKPISPNEWFEEFKNK